MSTQTLNTDVYGSCTPNCPDLEAAKTCFSWTSQLRSIQTMACDSTPQRTELPSHEEQRALTGYQGEKPT